jgi:hypothetical protein
MEQPTSQVRSACAHEASLSGNRLAPPRSVYFGSNEGRGPVTVPSVQPWLTLVQTGSAGPSEQQTWRIPTNGSAYQQNLTRINFNQAKAYSFTQSDRSASLASDRSSGLL